MNFHCADKGLNGSAKMSAEAMLKRTLSVGLENLEAQDLHLYWVPNLGLALKSKAWEKWKKVSVCGLGFFCWGT